MRVSPLGAPMTRRWHIALIACFFGMLWLPLADNALHLDRTRSTDENRALAPPPLLEASEQAVKEFPQRFEAWYDDRFGFRNFLVRQYHTVHFGWLGIADPEKVLKGKDGWLYLGRHAQIDEARGLNPMAEADVASWVTRLQAIRQWQEARGGSFFVVLVPDHYRVFPEYLPDWFAASETRRKEQLLPGLARAGVAVLDLTDALRAAKESSPHPIWLRTDTHWNGVGAYYGYRAILERLQGDFPDLAPMYPAALRLAETPPAIEGYWHNTGNLAAQLGVRDLVPETWLGLLPISPRAVPAAFPPPTRRVAGVNVPWATEIPGANQPRALVIGGSFRWALAPLLSEHFRRVLYTDFRYCFFDPALAAAEAPDVILFVMTEQQLLSFPSPPDEARW